MPLLIGMDEAGYGPNLGPLVVTAVVFEVPGKVTEVDLWREFAGIVSPDIAPRGEHIQIADSKLVYTPVRGLAALEAGVLTAVNVWRSFDSGRTGTEFDHVPKTFRELCQLVATPENSVSDSAAWHSGDDLAIPHVSFKEASRGDHVDTQLFERWRTRCDECGIRLREIRSAIISPRRFNERTRQCDNKARALSEISMHLLGESWQECATTDESALIIADKHGGRNRYHDFLPLAFGDQFIRCREEKAESSRYQVGRAEIRFETKSERYLPVALASMVSKYLRELSMILFNRFWTARVPGLKPTAGYPLDARRFRAAIAAVQRELGIPDDDLWRER